jgi:hypothetical protein
MSYSDSFPSVSPSYQIDFSNGGRIPPNATFSRPDSPINSSNAAASAVHYWSNEKHESSQNLILQSQNFGTTWGNSPTVGSGDASSGTGPDGSDSWLMTAATSGSATPSFNQDFSFKASTQYTYSVYVKAGTATHAWLAARGDTANSVTGTLNFSSPGSLATTAQGWTLNSSSVTAHGSWYRIVLTFTTNSTVSSPFVYVGLSDGAVPSTYYPAMTPNGETIYVWGAQIEERGSATAYNATTTQIHREYAPSLKSPSTAGAARFEYDPETNESLGCLIEGQSTNLFPNGATGYNSSNVFSLVALNGNQAQNAGIAPTGQLEATHWFEDTTAAQQQRIYQNVTATAAVHTFSGYFKYAGRDIILVRVENGGVFYGAKFQFSTETSSDYGSAAFSSHSVTSVGNGWYRFVATTPTLASGSTTTYINLFTGGSSGNSVNHDGDGYSGVLFYGLQFEANAFASSLISTVDSAKTRAADSLTVTDASIFNGGEHSVYWEGTVNGSTADPRLFELTGATVGNRIQVFHNDGNKLMIRTTDNGVTKASVQISESMAGNSKVVATLKNSEARLVRNGSTITSSTIDSFYSPAGIQSIKVGSNEGGGAQLDGHVKRVAYYSTALTETQAQALSN